MIAEADPVGATLTEYVWDDDGRPLAQVVGSTLTYLHPDHLGSPRIGTDSAKYIVWRWDDSTFGAVPPVGSVILRIRLPGQYAAPETSLFLNGYRTYNPLSGRYLESDPVGIVGGINTYGYVVRNRLRGLTLRN